MRKLRVGADSPVDLIREANLAFALNTYLFSTIQLPPNYDNVASPALETKTIAEQIASPDTKSWRNGVERLLVLGSTVVLGYAVSHFVVPVVTDYFAVPKQGRYEL